MPHYKECTSPNSTHVAPLALPSCNPPVLESSILTTGSTGAGSGFVKLRSFCEPPETTPPCTFGDSQEEEDVTIQTFVSDVRCKTGGVPGCAAGGADYTGSLINQFTLRRMTDHASGGSACTSASGAPPCVTATVQDFTLGTPISCTGTPGPAGAICSLTSTFNTMVPGMVKEGQSATVCLECGKPKAILLTDAGADGDVGLAGCPPTCGTGDEKEFVGQGVFLP